MVEQYVTAPVDAEPPLGARGSSCASAHTKTAALTSAMRIPARSGEVADPQPVRDRRVVRVDGSSGRRTCSGRSSPTDHVGDPPAPGDRGEDRAEGEERERVALVDAGRDGEEGEGQDGQADEQGQPVRPARGDRTATADDRGQQQRPCRRRRPARPRRSRRPEPHGRRGPGAVADPQAGVGQAVARCRPRRAPTGCRR